ncbi:hypothetical protein TSMEX_011248 [Taenia solium]|eukprot:TsM_000507200 transcript=TsM_000507200 gene=TsM_000507200
MNEALHQRHDKALKEELEALPQAKFEQECHLMSTEDKFMHILYNYTESSVEDKRFLIVNCDAVYQDRDDGQGRNCLATYVSIHILEQLCKVPVRVVRRYHQQQLACRCEITCLDYIRI